MPNCEAKSNNLETIVFCVMDSSSEDCDCPVEGFDPNDSKWVTANRRKRNKKKTDPKHGQSENIVGSRRLGRLQNKDELLLENQEGQNDAVQTSHSDPEPSSAHCSGELLDRIKRLEESIDECNSRLKQTWDKQDRVMETIQAGQAHLENIVQGQARMLEQVIAAQTDKQLSCISQVSGLCDHVVSVVQAKLDAVPKQLSQLEKAVVAQGEKLKSLAGDMEDIPKQVNKLKSTIESHSTQLADSSQQVNTLGSKLADLPGARGETAPAAAQQVAGMLDEYLDKEKRKRNVVVHNLPEQHGERQTEKTKNDSELFADVVKEHLHMVVNVSRCFRVGKTEGDKPRLLVVTLDSEEVKWEVLRQAPQLGQAPVRPRIFINPDLSPRERAEGKRLRDELKRRRENGETNLTIRRGRIVEVSDNNAREQRSFRPLSLERRPSSLSQDDKGDQRTSAVARFAHADMPPSKNDMKTVGGRDNTSDHIHKVSSPNRHMA